MDPKPQKYFVCYVDVLGQRDLMQGFASATGSEADDFRSQINGSSRELKGFYTGLREFVRGCMRDAKLRPFLREHGNSLARTLGDAAFKAEMGLVDVGVQQFSDSTIFYVSADQKLSAVVFALGFGHILREILRLQAEGVYLRGAVGYGDAWYVKGGQLCGEVLDDVGRTEGSFPFYSRIVCTKRYVGFLEAKCANRGSSTFDDSYIFLRDAIALMPDGVWSAHHDIVREAINSGSGNGSFDQLMGRIVARVQADSLKCREDAARKMSHGDVSGALKSARINWKYQWLYSWYTYGMPKDRAIPALEPRPKVKNWFEISEYYVAYLQFREYPALPRQMADFENWAKQSAVPATTWKSVDMVTKLLKVLAQLLGKKEGKDFGIQQLHTHIMVYAKKGNEASGDVFIRAMQQVAMLMPVFLQQGILFRGSLTVGKGWELEPNCLQGPVISDAYDLAINGAYHPRFLISGSLHREVEWALADKVLCGFLKQTIVQDVDGLWAWDYVGMMKYVRFNLESDADSYKQARGRALVWINEYGAMMQQIEHPTPAQVSLLQELQMLKCGYTRDLRRLAGSDVDLQARMIAADDVAKRLGGVDNAHFDKCFFRP